MWAESLRWLVKSGHPDQALGILNRIGNQGYGALILHEIKTSLKEASQKIDYKALWSRKVRPVLILGLVLAFFQQWCGINIVFNYAEEVFTSAGFGISASLLNIVATGVVNLAFTIVALRTVDRLGRRKLMLLGAAGLAITYLVLGGCYYFKLNGTIVLGGDPGGHRHLWTDAGTGHLGDPVGDISQPDPRCSHGPGKLHPLDCQYPAGASVPNY